MQENIIYLRKRQAPRVVKTCGAFFCRSPVCRAIPPRRTAPADTTVCRQNPVFKANISFSPLNFRQIKQEVDPEANPGIKYWVISILYTNDSSGKYAPRATKTHNIIDMHADNWRQFCIFVPSDQFFELNLLYYVLARFRLYGAASGCRAIPGKDDTHP